MTKIPAIMAFVFILFAPALLFAEGELEKDEVIIVRYFADGELAKVLNITPKGETIVSVDKKIKPSLIDKVQAFVVKDGKETPIRSASPTHLTAGEFRIGPDDVLEINVWQNDQLSKTIPVRPDGMITMPLLGDVKAAGLTNEDLKKKLQADLKRYVENPEVTVIVSQINSYKVFIQGSVANPGAYNISGGSTITQAVSLAGGFTEFADRNGIIILRTQADGTKKIKVKYKRIIAGKQPDTRLNPGDTIVVP